MMNKNKKIVKRRSMQSRKSIGKSVKRSRKSKSVKRSMQSRKSIGKSVKRSRKSKSVKNRKQTGGGGLFGESHGTCGWGNNPSCCFTSCAPLWRTSLWPISDITM
jgi:hypothetical protein